MVDVASNLQQRYLKEQQDYTDAVSAYEQTLNRVAASAPVPMAMETNYSVASGGYQRAATDPWMSKNHPELGAAATRLAKEEREFRALDDPSASHGNNKCSIVGYTAEKFYEYVAAAEMIYLLATDEKFREDVAAKLGSLFERGGLISDFFTVLGSGAAAEGLAYSGGNRQIIEANEAIIREGQAAAGRLVNRLKSYFTEKWEAFKKGWHECGLANAIVRAGIDGLFLAGEIAIGGAVMRGVRFAYQVTKAGLHRIEIIAVDKALTVGARSWSKEALEAKYGKPQQNQVAGLLKDENRSVPDRPATEKHAAKEKLDQRPDGSYRDPKDPAAVRRSADGEALLQDPKTGQWSQVSQSSNSLKGKFGEATADRYMQQQGYQKVNGPVSDMTTTGHQGIDGVYKKDGNPPSYVIADAKYGSAGLGKLKDKTVQMSPAWIRDRLGEAIGVEDLSQIRKHGYEPKLLRVDKYGNVTEESLAGRKWRDADK